MRLRGGLVASLFPMLAMAQDPVLDHRFSEPSSVRVVTTGGVTEVALQNVVHVPFETWSETIGRAQQRVATITTRFVRRTDREGILPGDEVTAAIWDLAAPAPVLLARITAPGSIGAVVAQRYLAATQQGCCGAPDLNRIFGIETGRFLFRSTGTAPLGASAWLELRRTGPALTRWAAFDAGAHEAGEKRVGVVGRITYGSDAGAIAAVTLLGKGHLQGLDTELAESARVVWRVDGETPDPGYGPPDRATPLRPPAGLSEAPPVSGAAIQLMLEGEILATLPVAGDQLDIGRARLDERLMLRAGVPRSQP